jgi:hypothetical protein
VKAKAAAAAKGADVQALATAAQLQLIELENTLKQIVALHPSSGLDAAKHAALNAASAELGWPLSS